MNQQKLFNPNDTSCWAINSLRNPQL